MAFESNWQKRQIWGAGVTAPILDIQFMEHDESEPRNITGFGVGVNFWYHDSTTYHVQGQGYVSDGDSGVATYAPDGTEAPTVGDLIYQVEIMNPGSTDSSVEEWATLSSPVFKVRVRESQP
jgi:hypothetical protein